MRNGLPCSIVDRMLWQAQWKFEGERWRQDAIRSTRKEIKPGIGTDTPPPIRRIVDSTLVVNGKRANFENWNQFISGGVPSMAVFYEAEFIDRSW